jgi:predicted AAA+ superfamily ATPase
MVKIIISFWRTASGSEVDLILGDAEVAIEVKASSSVSDRTKGLHLFHEENKCRKSLIISKEQRPRKISSRITVLPWQNFCEMLWAGDIL